MEVKRQCTLKEIAELAGVSRATVDRVIKGKGPVAKKTQDKIKVILEKVDYQPNFMAQSLRKREVLKIAIIIPDSDFDVYWKKAIEGIDKVADQVSFIGIEATKYLFNPFKEASFKLNCRQIFKEKYDGIIVAPVFYKQSLDFLKTCKEKNIPYITFNTHIEEEGKLCHIGQDLVQSGAVAASLLYKLTGTSNDYLVLHIDEDIANAKHMQEKESGFKNSLKDKGVDIKQIKTLSITNVTLVEKMLLQFLEKNSQVKSIFVTTSKVHYVADVIEAYNLDINLLGYDLLDENVEHLKQDVIDFLIFQNPLQQAASAMTALIEYLSFKRQVPAKKLLPIDIVIKENIRDY